MADVDEDLMMEECRILEDQELTLPNDNAKSEVYPKLLAIYILQNDLVQAKFLWKRIPENIKANCSQLELLWKIGQLLWTRKFASVHLALNQEWPDNVRRYIEALREKLRERVKSLISKAYSNIRTEEFANLLGMTDQEAMEGKETMVKTSDLLEAADRLSSLDRRALIQGETVARQIRWQIDNETGFIHPTTPDYSTQADVTQAISSEKQLACLTDYISYLEN